jgi:hypothetical protein
MEKNSLLPFFEVLSSKFNFCLFPKNTISRLGFRLPNLSHSAKISLMVFTFFVSSVSFAQLKPSSSYDLSYGAAFHYSANKQYDSRAYGQKIKKLANFTTHNPLISQWETIQSVKLVQPNSSINSRIALAPVKINLDQVRNGSGASPIDPANWVNGNAGASNAHYVEGWSIPYRAVFTDLPIVADAVRTIDIEWDIKHTGANAIDFITNYDLINFALGTHATNFGHTQETINPIFGFETLSGFKDVENIPQPNLPATSPYPGAGGTFAAIQNAAGDKGAMTIWGGTIIGMTYVSEGNLANPSASTRLRITFTNTSSTVILSWGGHIAKASDWGLGNSASAVSGSPYHTRLISYTLDGTTQISIGNQDRSLSAAAVVDPPACMLSGPTPVECNTQNTYTNNLTSLNGYTYSWTLIDNTSGATIASNDGFLSATVNSGTGCDKAYTLRFTLKNNNIEISHCDYTVAVDDNTIPVLSAAPDGVTVSCLEDVPEMTNLTWTDNCDTGGSVAGVDGALVGGECGGTITRTWNVSDACGNPAETRTQIITINDNTIPVLAAAPDGVTVSCIEDVPAMTSLTWTDNCDTGGSVAGVDGALVGGECGGTITRTWNVSDACGNPAETRTQIITINDNTIPVLAAAPDGVTVSCIEDVPALTSLIWTDNCDDGGSVEGVDGALVGGECGGTITRTWNVSDACGNPAETRTQIITINDNTIPVLAAAPDGVTVSCIEDVPALTSLIWTDNCDDGGSVEGVDGALVGGECGGTITRKWDVSDACGNPAVSRTQIITINDTTPPVITCPADATVEFGASTEAGTATAEDNCSDAEVSSIDETYSVGCQSVIVRTWTATDDCGNSASCEQHILIIDRTSPEITCNTDGSVSATDNSGTVYLYQKGDLWTAIDASGNMSTKTCEEVGSKIAPSKQLEQTVIDTKKASTTSYTETEGFEVFPVPFKDQLTIKYNFDYVSDVKIEVFNAQGISVLTKVDTNSYLNKEITLNLNSNSGREQVYVIKVTTNRGSSTKKILSSK